MEIWFHGTTKEAVDTILHEGFRAGTYFGQHLEDALHFGGWYIFEVYFEESPSKNWQVQCLDPIPPSRIRCAYSLSPKVLHENMEAYKRIKELSIQEEWGDRTEICHACNGEGQLEHYPPFIYWRDIHKVTTCPDCNGYGQIPNEHELMEEERRRKQSIRP